jgi:hypothetical protein
MTMHISNSASVVPAFLLLSLVSASAGAATVYDVTIASGSITTSGGLTGGGFGTLDIAGTLTATFTDTTVQFSNINVSTSPGSQFVFPDYAGTFNGTSFSGSQPVPLLGVLDSYTGMLSGNNLTLSGVYHEPFADGYQYNYNISALASPVPVPGALLLFVSGMGVVLRLARTSA